MNAKNSIRKTNLGKLVWWEEVRQEGHRGLFQKKRRIGAPSLCFHDGEQGFQGLWSTINETFILCWIVSMTSHPARDLGLNLWTSQTKSCRYLQQAIDSSSRTFSGFMKLWQHKRSSPLTNTESPYNKCFSYFHYERKKKILFFAVDFFMD